MPKFPVQIMVEIEATDQDAARKIAEAACEHLQQTFNDDGSLVSAFTVEDSGFAPFDELLPISRAVVTQPADQPGDFYVMLDYEQSAAHAPTIEAARAAALRIFMNEPLPCTVSIADGEGNTLEDLGFCRSELVRRGYSVWQEPVGYAWRRGREHSVSVLPIPTEERAWLDAAEHFRAHL